MERQALVSRHRYTIRSVILFLCVFAALQFGFSLCQGTLIEHVIIDDLTVTPNAFLINAISPQEHVQALGHSLVSPWGRLNVLNGCEGLESMFLVIAALFASRLPFAAQLKGIFWSVLVLYALNQVRITVLYFAGRYDRGLFAMIHGYIGPTLIVIIGTLFFLWWTDRYRVVDP